MTVQATIELARSAGKDAGDRSMRAAGRTIWNEQDHAEAVRVCNRILDVEQYAINQRWLRGEISTEAHDAGRWA